jgi:hypothetical protein
LCFGIKKYPADYYMVILSGHGSGTEQDFFLRDENGPLSLIPSSLNIPDLEQVFTKGGDVDKALEEAKRGGKINILGFDACLMSMAEICYQLRASVVDLMIGSEGFSPSAGWPLHSILKVLNNKPNIEPEPLARRIVNRYTRFYLNYELGGLSVDISVLKIDRIENLTKKVKKLVEVLTRKLNEALEQQKVYCTERSTRRTVYAYEGPPPPFIDAIIMSHWEAQSYNGEVFVDLYDFCNILRQRYTKKVAREDDEKEIKAVQEACLDVMDAIAGKKDSVVLHSCYNGPAYQYSYGVSIYFPWSCTEFSPHYFRRHEESEARQEQEHAHLDFPTNKVTGWGEFLRLYFKATILRPPRSFKELKISDGVRSGPPASRGPNARVRSMRNPTPYYFKSPCAKKERDGSDTRPQETGEKSDA